MKTIKSENKLLILLLGLKTKKKLVVSLVVVGFLFLASILTFNEIQKFQEIRSRAATVPNRLPWQGKDWYLLGANVPWYNWACDFGCNVNGGVSGNKPTLGTGFQKMKDNNVRVARWWVFPGDPWQITRDANGPTGLDPAIYADFDAALQLADQYDLYYNFVLFSGATAPPKAWLTDPAQRAKLGQALAPLFARYANNPRVMSWEIYNEPEFQIWNNEIDETSAVETAKVIANTVHQNSPALVTIGNAFADGIPMWKDVALDYYSPHWYDYMSSGNYCIRCQTAAQLRSNLGITDNKPIVVGETYASSTVDAQARMTDFYNNGYAGAWPWSVFSNRTSDQLTIDFPALKAFTIGKTDIGPQSSSATPTGSVATNTPTKTPTPSLTSTPAKIADLNNDGQVNVFDLSILLTNFGTTNPIADINHDNQTNVFDLSILLTNFGK